MSIALDFAEEPGCVLREDRMRKNDLWLRCYVPALGSGRQRTTGTIQWHLQTEFLQAVEQRGSLIRLGQNANAAITTEITIDS